MAPGRDQVDLPVQVRNAFRLIRSWCSDSSNDIRTLLLPEDGDGFFCILSAADFSRQVLVQLLLVDVE